MIPKLFVPQNQIKPCELKDTVKIIRKVSVTLSLGQPSQEIVYDFLVAAINRRKMPDLIAMDFLTAFECVIDRH